MEHLRDCTGSRLAWCCQLDVNGSLLGVNSSVTKCRSGRSATMALATTADTIIWNSDTQRPPQCNCSISLQLQTTCRRQRRPSDFACQRSDRGGCRTFPDSGTRSNIGVVSNDTYGRQRPEQVRCVVVTQADCSRAIVTASKLRAPRISNISLGFCNDTLFCSLNRSVRQTNSQAPSDGGFRPELATRPMVVPSAKPAKCLRITFPSDDKARLLHKLQRLLSRTAIY